MTNPSSFLRVLILAFLLGITKPDPDPLQDYCVANTSATESFFINGSPCINPDLAIPSHFTTSALSKAGDTNANPFRFNITLTNIRNMPGINTQGLTMGRIDLGPDGVVPLHWHPRASEIVYLLQGNILVGFVDTSNRLFTENLRPGDTFVFPRGMVHFLYNTDLKRPAFVLTGLNSQNPGAELAALAAFVSKPTILTEVLQKTFQISGQDVQRIKKNLGG